MRYRVINNDPTDKVNYRKQVQIINDKQYSKWRLESAQGLEVPISNYLIIPMTPLRKLKDGHEGWNRWAEKHEFDIQAD